MILVFVAGVGKLNEVVDSALQLKQPADWRVAGLVRISERDVVDKKVSDVRTILLLS